MFNKSTEIAAPRAEISNAFMRNVYLWMAAGLAVTAIVSFATMQAFPTRKAVAPYMGVFFGLMIAELVIVFFLSSRIHKLSAFAASAAFLLYSALNGLTLTPLLLNYTNQSIFNVFLTTAGMFGAMSVYGMVTKRDLTSMGSFMMMGLWGIIIAMVVNMFIGSGALSLGISVIGVFIFLGLTAYDTQKLRNLGESAPMDDALAVRRGAIMGALDLYLDFINLFIMMLRIFADRR